MRILVPAGSFGEGKHAFRSSEDLMRSVCKTHAFLKGLKVVQKDDGTCYVVTWDWDGDEPPGGVVIYYRWIELEDGPVHL